MACEWPLGWGRSILGGPDAFRSVEVACLLTPLRLNGISGVFGVFAFDF